MGVQGKQGRRAIETDIVAEIAPTAWMAARGAALHRGDDGTEYERMPDANANIGDPTPEAQATLESLVHTVNRGDLAEVSRKCVSRVKKFIRVFGADKVHEKMQDSLDEFREAGKGELMSERELLAWHETFSYRLDETVRQPLPEIPTPRARNSRKSWDPSLAYADSHVLMFLIDQRLG